MACVSRKMAIAILIIAIVVSVICVIVLACFPLLYNVFLYKQISLVNNSMEFEMWRDLPVPIYEKLYYFNITNGKEFLEKKEKLNVVQVGPYVFKANWKKDAIRWHPNRTVTYQEMRVYHFLPNESSGSLDDEIVTLNGPMITAANFLKDTSFWVKAFLTLFFIWKREEIIIKRSIRELTYDGYYDPIIDYGWLVMPNLPFKDGMFAWLAGKNATYDGQFTVFTGEGDIKKLNIINNWNGQDRLTFWPGDTCNMINGSSVEVNPPLDDGQREMSFFQSFFCRSLTFSYNDMDVNHKGILTKRFVATDKIFANRRDNPDNYCFDTQPSLRSGLQYIGACQFNAPAFLSFPHFFLADPYYENAIDGLNSSGQDYISYVDIEPTTGITVDAKLNFQLNLQLAADPEIVHFIDIPEGFFPVLWAEITVSLPDDLNDMVRTKLHQPKVITYSILGIVIGIALVLIVVSAVILVQLKSSHRLCVRSDGDPILSSRGEFGPNLSNTFPPSAPPHRESQEQNVPAEFKSGKEGLSKHKQKMADDDHSFHEDDELLVDA